MYMTRETGIQSIIFNKEYWTQSEANNWLKKHNRHPIKAVHETKHFYRYRIKRPSGFKRYITKKLDNGIELIIGYK